MNKRRNNTSKRRVSGVYIAICTVFTVSLGLYLASSLWLKSLNNELSVKNQKIQNTIAETQSEIEDLQGEISVLEDKNRVLGMLDYQVYDNKDNIYVIDGSQ